MVNMRGAERLQTLSRVSSSRRGSSNETRDEKAIYRTVSEMATTAADA